MTKTYHNPVLLHESVDGLQIQPNGIYVDVTYGGGGHSRAILSALGKQGKLIGFDQDNDALVNEHNDSRLTLVNNNFKFLKNFLRFHDALPVDGILADLGVSSHQFDEGIRGFSTRFDGRLDMRMDMDRELSALDVVNTYTSQDLFYMFRNYADLKNSSAIAKRITEARVSRSIETTFELKQVLESLAPRHRENKFFAQVFQALRIEVNDELGTLKSFLEQAAEVLKPGGRLVVISYHSLEDRLVKQFIQYGNFHREDKSDVYGKKKAPLIKISRKAIIPNQKEIDTNSRARSAKMRIAEKV